MLNVTLKQIRIFVEVARSQSFAGGASALHLTQPAVSLAIQSLEQQIEGKLFARSTRTLVLTPEGESFYPVALRMLREWDEALADVHNQFTMQRGKLNMAVMPTFSLHQLPSIIQQYHQAYPQININIQDIVMEDAIESVRAERNELAVTFEAEQMQGVSFTPLFNDHFVGVYSPKAVATTQAKKLHHDWQTFFDLPMVAMNRDSMVRRRVISVATQNQLKMDIVAEANQLATVGHLVASGIGVAIVPAICQQQMQALGLNCVGIPHEVLQRQIGIVTKVRRPLSVAAQHMVKLLTDFFAAQADSVANV